MPDFSFDTRFKSLAADSTKEVIDIIIKELPRLDDLNKAQNELD